VKRDWRLTVYDRSISAIRRGALDCRRPLAGTLPGILLAGWIRFRWEYQVKTDARAAARCRKMAHVE